MALNIPVRSFAVNLIKALKIRLTGGTSNQLQLPTVTVQCTTEENRVENIKDNFIAPDQDERIQCS